MNRKPQTWVKRVTGAALALGAVTALFGAQGCLDRPVVPITPSSGGLIVRKLRVQRVDKLDLLFVVDNSISMADKQSELGKRIPELIFALTDDTPDPKTGKPQNVIDVHVGVVTSSLGSHGTSVCSPESTKKPHDDDRGHLLPRSEAQYTGVGNGFKVSAVGGTPEQAPCPGGVAAASPVTWVYEAKQGAANFTGKPGSADLQTATSCVIQSVKDDGCGYEEVWEGMYHFLIDPAPWASAKVQCVAKAGGDDCGQNDIVVEGVDDTILAQRKAFLRDDSLLAVVVLGDENDFSLKPAGKNWLPWGFGPGRMPRGWGACANVPDDIEPDDNGILRASYGCTSCLIDKSDPNCNVAWPDARTAGLNTDVDARNLRGFQQVQRYGFNFLWSRQRYVDGLTKPTLIGGNGQPVANPIYKGGRTQDLVIVAGIVGVPKGLVSDDQGRAKVLTDADWEKIIGPKEKRDPHMIESIAPREGIAKFAGDHTIDPVNGGDRDISDGSDLQYACIAPRTDTRPTDDCQGSNAAKNPLCDAATNTQPRLKAYPGLRHLRIIRDLGASGFVASICNDTYQPAIQGITEKLKAALNAQCITSSLTVQEDKSVNCLIVESFREGTDGGATCESLGKGLCTPGKEPCRKEGDPNYPPVTPEVAAQQLTLPITVIGGDGASVSQATPATVENGNVYLVGSDNRKHLVCELQQLAGGRADDNTTQSCLTNPDYKIDPAAGGGWCFSQTPAVIGDQCTRIGATGTIRFLGGAEPRNGSEVFTLCIR
jgi:hypothetical protein